MFTYCSHTPCTLLCNSRHIHHLLIQFTFVLFIGYKERVAAANKLELYLSATGHVVCPTVKCGALSCHLDLKVPACRGGQFVNANSQLLHRTANEMKGRGHPECTLMAHLVDSCKGIYIEELRRWWWTGEAPWGMSSDDFEKLVSNFLLSTFSCSMCVYLFPPLALLNELSSLIYCTGRGHFGGQHC